MKVGIRLSRPYRRDSIFPLSGAGHTPRRVADPASVPVAGRDDVGLDGVVGRVRRRAHGDGPFEPGSGGGIGTVAPRCQADGALLLLGTVAGASRSVAA